MAQTFGHIWWGPSLVHVQYHVDLGIIHNRISSAQVFAQIFSKPWRVCFIDNRPGIRAISVQFPLIGPMHLGGAFNLRILSRLSRRSLNFEG